MSVKNSLNQVERFLPIVTVAATFGLDRIDMTSPYESLMETGRAAGQNYSHVPVSPTNLRRYITTHEQETQ